MRLTQLAFLRLALAVGATPASCNTTCDSVQNAQDALTFAFTYGYPLYAFSDLVQTNESLPTNYLIHQRKLRTAEDRQIVRPNADTLYSNLFIDLSRVDLEITVPDFGDRYGVWPFYDIYGNNFANIGSVNNFTSGTYLLHFNSSNSGITPSPNASYSGIINMSTPYGQSIIRIVTDNSTSDLSLVHTLQDALSVRPIPRLSDPPAPPFNLSIFQDPYFRSTNTSSLPEAVLRLTAALAPLNPPSAPQESACVAAALALAGCQNGTWTPPAGTNLTAAVESTNASVSSLLADPESTSSPGNGWTLLAPELIGNYGTNYVARFFVASWAYLALSSEAALYPSPSFASSSATLLGADQALLIRFSARPVLAVQGFWSLTLYDSDGFFVPNALGRYALGDRSNLTFPDGTAVYGGDERDGEFEILVQPEDVVPPGNWTGNWLPMTKGGGELEWNLRWYGAEKEMLAGGGYVYPTVELVDAIRG